MKCREAGCEREATIISHEKTFSTKPDPRWRHNGEYFLISDARCAEHITVAQKEFLDGVERDVQESAAKEAK